MFSGSAVGVLLDDADAAAPGSELHYIHSRRLSGITRAVSQIEFGGQDPSSLEKASSWLRRRSQWTLPELFKHLLCAIDPLIGLEKSPDNASSEEALNRFFETFPDARVIHLTRHPTTALHSLIEAHKRYENWDRKFIPFSASVWYVTHRRILAAVSSLPRYRVIRVRAEDLINDPDSHLPPVLDWLGLKHNTDIIQQMKRTEEWCFAGTGQYNDLYGGDWKFLASPELRPVKVPSSITFDDSWPLRPEAKRRIQDLALELGYQ